MFKRRISIVLFCTVLLLVSCSKNKLDVNVSNIDAPVEIKRFDLAFYEIDANNFEKELPNIATTYPAVFKLSNFSTEDWKNQYNDDYYKDIYTEVKKSLADFSNQEEALEVVFKHFKYYYPERTIPTVYTYLSGMDFELPVLYLDTVLFIATDDFLGPNTPLYNTLPNYLAEDYSKKYIATEVAKEIGKTLNKPAEGNSTLLDDMIYHGKLLYFTDAMMPKVDDHIKIQYTAEEIKWCKENEYYMWAELVEQQLLFSKKNTEKQRFITPAPFSKFYLQIDNESPGRIGQWLGWQIVRKYMEKNKDVTLQELMNNNSSETILKNSKYKPSK